MRNYKSILAILLVGVVYAVSLHQYKPYKAFTNHEGGDAFGYYVYLPSIFIYHDLADLHKTMAAKYHYSSPWRKVRLEDNYQNKYFMGTAVLQAPFFLTAHWLAPHLHYAQDGFSMIYMYSVEASCMAYALLSLWLILLILRRRFDDGVIAIVILILGLGTNLYYLVVEQPPFCHAYLLFWYALLIYFTIRFYDSLKGGFLLLMGFAAGMIVLTRPNELYAVLIPLCWGLSSKKDVIERYQLLIKNIWYVLGAGLIAALCVLPQLMYWRVSTGHYFFYSYQDEKFDFKNPHIWGGFFSGSNGWLVYSPIMALSLVGIWFAAKRKDASLAPLLTYLPVHIYVIYCWWCWFYMGSYGSRPMTEAYALLSIPLAYTVEWCQTSWIKRTVLLVLSVFCIWLVMFQTYQSVLGIFNSELSNWKFNVVTMGKTKLTYEESIVLDTKEFQPSNPVFVKVLSEHNFEYPAIPGSDTTVAASGHRSVCVKMDSFYFGYTGTLRQAGAKKGQWIKASVNCLTKEPTNHNWHLSSLVIMFTERGNRSAKWKTLGMQNKINNPKREIYHFPTNEWGRVYFYSQIPSDMTDKDEIRVYVEHKNGPDIYIDDMKVELYEEK